MREKMPEQPPPVPTAQQTIAILLSQWHVVEHIRITPTTPISREVSLQDPHYSFVIVFDRDWLASKYALEFLLSKIWKKKYLGHFSWQIKWPTFWWCWLNFQCRASLNLDFSTARAYRACGRCGWGWFGHFHSSSFSLSLGDGPI